MALSQSVVTIKYFMNIIINTETTTIILETFYSDMIMIYSLIMAPHDYLGPCYLFFVLQIQR